VRKIRVDVDDGRASIAPMLRHGRRAALIAAVVLVAGVYGAGAETVYKWTDEKGTVHFADVPPPHAGQYKSEDMPDAPPPAAAPAEATPAAGAEGAKPADGSGPGGPARVVLTDHKAVQLGPTQEAYRGAVKNEGGVEARDVVISIVVTEPIQGAECLHDQIDVEPSTLPPGGVGTFEAEFDNPCYHGPTEAALQAEWR
jgi:hypothetical protein